MNDNSSMTDDSVKNSTTSLKKYKILVVEDEEDAKIIFKTLISTNPDYDVYAAGDGSEALKILKSKDFDLVLLDIIMPTMDGIETLKHIKTEPGNYGTPIVIMLTNIGGEKAVEHAKEFRADGYILKIDVEPGQLMKKIAEILEKGGDKDSILKQEVRDNISSSANEAPATTEPQVPAASGSMSIDAEPEAEAVSQQ